jgi:hypothetical protein
MSWDPKQTPHERPAKPSSVLKISHDARQEAIELRERALARQEASIQRARAVAHAGFRDTDTIDGSGIRPHSRGDGRTFPGNPSLYDDHRYNVALDDDPYDLFREPKVYYCSPHASPPHASPPRESPPREQPRTLRPFEVTDYHGVRHMSTTPYPRKDRSALGFGWGELSAGSPGLGNGQGGSSFRSGTVTSGGVGDRVKRPVDCSTQGSSRSLTQSLGRKEKICGGSATRLLADPPTVDQVPSSRPPRLDFELIGRVGQGGQTGSAGQLNSGMEAGWLVQKHKY